MENILKLMAQKKASDAYLSAFAPVTIKVNGQSIPINSQQLTADATLKLLAEVLPPECIELLEKSHELSTTHSIEGLGNFRFSALRQRGTYAAVVRYIANEVPAIESLNLPSTLPDLIMEKRGLILVVGATGAGKSTTVASMLDYRNARMSGHILTVEDPIEYLFTNKKSIVNQREVGSDTASMGVALKNALRQAPDVIFIGEIRDREAMSEALSYAQSGHMCIATMHASNSYHALHRILSLYPIELRPSLLGELSVALKAIVSQRLMRTLRGTRIPAVELLYKARLIQDLIETGDFSTIKDAMEKSLTEGSQTFEQDIARLIKEGAVDRREGLSHADSPTNLIWRLDNHYAAPPKAPSLPQVQANEGPSFTEFTLDVKH